MAIKPLQSITFPGLPDIYKVPSTPEEVGAAPMVYAQQVGSPRNFLDNSDFTNPINQREKTSYTATGSYTFTIDRWKMNYGTITVNDGYINWTTSEEAQYKKLIQIIPHTLKAGQTYTLAMFARVNKADYTVLRFADNSGGGLSGASVILSATNDFAWFIISYNMSKDLVQPRVEILTGSETSQNINIDIKAIALYEGEYTIENLPEYQSKGYAAELLECQRYFINLGNSSFGFGFVSANGTSCGIIIPLPTKMRATPTVTADNFRIKYRTLQKSVSNFAVTKINSSSILLTVTESFTVDSSGSGAPAIAFSNALTLSADL